MRPTLRRSAEFELVYTQGRKFTTRALVIFHLEAAAEPRVAFVASRKVGIAVQRNRAKRLLRAAFRELEASPPSLPGWIVLVARRDIITMKSGEVAALLREVFPGRRAAPHLRP
jgi:ribonuclease P protein component